MPGIGVVVGELPGLVGDRVGDLGAPVAAVHAVEAGERVQAAAPLAVADVDPLAAGDHTVRRLAPRLAGTVGRDRKSVVWGKSVSLRVDLGGCRFCEKKKTQKNQN